MSQSTLRAAAPRLSTTVSGFRYFLADEGEAVASSGADVLNVQFLIEGRDEAPSKRSGRKPRLAESAQRESADRAYGEAKARARRALAGELGELLPASLARIRLERGLSQHQVALAVGTSQPHIAKIEAGRVELRLSTAAKLASILEVSIDQIHDATKAKSVECSAAVQP